RHRLDPPRKDPRYRGSLGIRLSASCLPDIVCNITSHADEALFTRTLSGALAKRFLLRHVVLSDQGIPGFTRIAAENVRGSDGFMGRDCGIAHVPCWHIRLLSQCPSVPLSGNDA